MTQIARLLIQRGASGGTLRIETFEVPFETGSSLLDGLRWIRATSDPTLAIRYSCINANACKECMMELEGKAVYACTERLREGDMHVAPLHNKALVRDLISEIAPTDERLIP